MPTHVTEALRTNMSGGKTVSQLLAQAAATVPFMSMAELKARVEAQEDDLIVLDVRERDAYEAAHIPGRACCRAGSSSCASTRICPIRPGASSPAASSATSRPWPHRRCAKWVSACRGARRRHESVARVRLPDQAGPRALTGRPAAHRTGRSNGVHVRGACTAKLALRHRLRVGNRWDVLFVTLLITSGYRLPGRASLQRFLSP
jgi:rhodanese-related sulfurtransferase